MITKMLRYINILFQICLIVIICLFLIRIYNKEESVEHVVRGFDVVEPTYSYTKNETENDDIELKEMIMSDSPYNETAAWSIRYPDIILDDYIDINKDAYGNYVLTEDMFLNVDVLPFNEEGYIDYIFYYDEEGNVLNPLPELYNKYLDYFGLSGG